MLGRISWLARAVCMAVACVSLVSAASADVFNMGPGLTSLETVHVGNPGNPGEWSGESYGGAGPDRICGAVDYEYNIGKYEVTAGQYCEFLNAVAGVDTYYLYNTNMWSNDEGCKIERYAGSGTVGDPYQYRVAADYANRPVNYVSWGDGARFANWLTNGQGNGSTETGSYDLNGAMRDTELMGVAVPSAAQRGAWSTGATPYFLLPSEDEWYKAAYHKNDGATGNYFDYATSSDTAPGYVDNSANLSTTGNPFVEGGTDPGNYATYNDDYGTEGIGNPYYRTVAGEWENSDSPYGTFDQCGNVWEWNEAVFHSGRARGLLGGSFFNTDHQNYPPFDYYLLRASFRSGTSPVLETSIAGFRVSEVPEPASMAILALGAVGMLRRRKSVRA